MGSKGWIKRVLPFFATFAVGIMIAGFFGFGGPRFGRHGRWQMRMEMEHLRGENEELKNENLRLRNNCHGHDMDIDLSIPDVDVVPFDAPPPSRTLRVPMRHHPPKSEQ